MTLSNPISPPVAAGAPRRSRGSASLAAGNAWVERFARFGLVVRGIIYSVPGILALLLALGIHGAVITPTGAIEMIGHQPFGRVLLVAVAIGLGGYSLWGVVRAVFDPLRKGHTPAGIFKRLGYATSALAYAGFLVGTLHLLGVLSQATRSDDWASGLLTKPFGAWMLAIVGLCWIAGAGIGEIVRGWRGSFGNELDFSRMGPGEGRWAMRLGRFGITARGVVFTVVGILLVRAAMYTHSGRASGIDDALRALEHQPFGRLLLAAAGLGLVAFGIYSAMCARWMRMHVTGTTPA